MLRYLLIWLACLCLALPAASEEVIHEFNADIDVRQNGDILVTETISVTPEGRQINRGIYRALPRYFEEDGERFRYDYDIRSIRRNGEKEPYDTYTEGNAYMVRIGDEDVYLPLGDRQTYEIRYRVKNQIRYFETHDELYWNVTGSYWEFPMQAVRANVRLPDNAEITFQKAFTGGFGEPGTDYESRRTNDGLAFETTQPLDRREGLTISIGLEKGLIDPPSVSDKGAKLWQRYGALGLLVASLVGVFWFYFRSWQRVGQDAPRLPVYARYHPPENVSPAAAHHVYHRRFVNRDGFSGSLVDLAVKGWLTISTEDDVVTLKKANESERGAISTLQKKLYDDLLGAGESREIGGEYDSEFATIYSDYNSSVAKAYGEDYFRWNTLYVVLAGGASIAGIIFSVAFAVNWTLWHTLLVLALIGVNLAFFYFMPAQTRKGEALRSEIAGFRLYLETAEKLALNQADVHGDKPPPMSKGRYEALLPYAIALGVEKPWSEYFEHALPDDAKAYNPGWSHSAFYGSNSLHGMNSALSGSISSSVATASVQPSSSSGSGGGGFSGGGGGGGGGGGW